MTDSSVDSVGGNIPGADDLPKGRFVDLGGSTGDPGQFSTRLSFPLLSGHTYNLFFEYRSTDGSPNSATVTFAGETHTVSSSSTDFKTFSQDFIIDGSTVLSPIVFRDLGIDNSGIGIDAILLSQVAVPEPLGAGALAIVGTAIIGWKRGKSYWRQEWLRA